MKDIRLAIKALISAYPPVQAIAGTRIYPGQLPQGQRNPSVVFNKIAGTFGYTLTGSAGLIQNLMQIDAIAESQDVATNLANVVHDVLSGFKGDVPYGNNSPQDLIYVNGIFQSNSTDFFDNVLNLNRVSYDYVVWYREN